jgi:hypothetical protein
MCLDNGGDCFIRPMNCNWARSSAVQGTSHQILLKWSSLQKKWTQTSHNYETVSAVLEVLDSLMGCDLVNICAKAER